MLIDYSVLEFSISVIYFQVLTKQLLQILSNFVKGFSKS